MIAKPIPHSDEWELVDDLFFRLNGKGHFVPGGYRSDGASIPRLFWTVTTTPFNPRVIRAAFIHDYLYGLGTLCNREEADGLFKEIMLEDGCDPETADTLHGAVRLCAGGHWCGKGGENGRVRS